MKDEIKEMLQEIKEMVDNYLKIYKLEDDMMYDTINYKASQWYALLDYITNLQQEKEDYKSRNEKAIEYIKEHIRIDDEYPAYMEMLVEEKDELLNILNGGDDNE